MITVIQNYTVNDIVSSIKYLLDKASKSEEVRQLAVQVTYAQQDKIAGIYDWIKSNVAYIPDPVRGNDEIELFISPVRLVKDYNQGIAIGEDCDGMAILATSLYRAIGIKSNVVIIDSVGNGLDHAYCQAWCDKLEQFISVDPSSNNPLGWELVYKEKVIID